MNKKATKKQLAEELNVSTATIHNWIKTGIIPAPDNGRLYSLHTAQKIIDMTLKQETRLHSRANRSLQKKTHMATHGIKEEIRIRLLSELVEHYLESGLSIHEGVLALCIAMLRSNNLFDANSVPFEKIKLWISEIGSDLKKLAIFESYIIENCDDDIIGAFYQSIQTVASKSNMGAFYTPVELLESIKIEKDKKILDPCCGSGGILLQIIDKSHDPHLVYARDVDQIALQVCEVNLILFFKRDDFYFNVSKIDILEPLSVFSVSSSVKRVGESAYTSTKKFLNKTPHMPLVQSDCMEGSHTKKNAQEYFDYIVTNPPWGSKLSITKKKQLVSTYANLATSETFSVALYNSLKMLAPQGELHFFLPQSFLTVATHKGIRKEVLEKSSRVHIRLLGAAFKGVVSEAILMSITKNDVTPTFKELEIFVTNQKGQKYQLNTSRIKPPNYRICALINPEDETIINKFFDMAHSNLKDASFGLGIVTGANSIHLLSQSNSATKPIYRGKDIVPYRLLAPKYFIQFRPKKYHQVAPVELFMQKKIVYRFISNKIICALDAEQNLILNSANFFISHSYPMDTIVCLFNSLLYSYVFQKLFHSTKVLKSHLQIMPLPKFSQEQHTKFKKYHDEICMGRLSQMEIDKEIAKIFNVTDIEFNYIKGQII